MERMSDQFYKRKLRSISKARNFLCYCTICFLLVGVSVITIFGQDAGQKAFESKCFSCHNIGGGDKQGPDLKGVTDRRSIEWLDEFIKSPTAMSKKDADAAELFRKFAPEIMPDQTVSPEEITALIELIRSLSSKNEMFTPAGAKLARAIVEGDIDAGSRLFLGQTRLENGGVACGSCHSVSNIGAFGGGTLGPDLTAVNIKYRDPELILILQNPNFPTMTEMFRDRQLTEEEIVKLFAYLQNSKQINPHAPVVATTDSGKIEPKFLALGFVITIFSLVGMNLIWRKRHKGVREEIVRRSKI